MTTEWPPESGRYFLDLERGAEPRWVRALTIGFFLLVLAAGVVLQ